MTDNMLLGQAGVYFVAGELSRRGYIALVTTRNTKSYDILAYNPAAKRNLQLQIKSTKQRHKDSDNDDYIVLTTNQDALEEKLQSIESYHVFVYFPKGGHPRYFVTPPKELQDIVREAWNDYIEHTKHRKGIEDIKKAQNPIGPWIGQLKKYENRWDLLET
ncbi:MAG: hypothetical protein QXJ17_03950 [Nitrososphaeria archaeon]